MKKSCLIFIFLFCFSVVFTAEIPTVSGKGSIRNDLPPEVKPPTTIFKTANIKSPFPTNKWFNSVLCSKYSINLYSYPQVFKCNLQEDQSRGLLIAYPEIKYYGNIINYGSNEDNPAKADIYANKIKVAAYSKIENGAYINCTSANLDNYSDFSTTIKWEDKSDNSKWIKATIGQGFIFSYFEVSDNIYPALEVPHDWTHGTDTGNFYHIYTDTNTEIQNYETFCTNDRILIRLYCGDKDTFYGIFAPKGTRFCQANTADNRHRIFLDMSNVTGNKYFSIALLPAASLDEAGKDFEECYKYAYNFVTETKADWKVKTDASSIHTTTNFNFTTTKKRTDIENQRDGTIFCLYPHQYKNSSNLNVYASSASAFANTLRGDLKICCGSSFITEVQFKGIVPFFNYNISQDAKIKISNALQNDKNLSFDPTKEDQKNTYFYGKNLAKIANLISVADNLSDESIKNELIQKVKNELVDWFTYSSGKTSKYFAYDTFWGGLIGIYDGFGTENYNDHNFHYGYFVYASAMLAMYDTAFAKDYGDIVELLIKDFANTKIGDKSFPYMRNFDFYESHCWANGMGGADDRGIDLESSSEAMNAWAAVYMWGLATQQQKYIDLGIYLYTNEYEAIKNYFFDVDKSNIIKENSDYTHISLGILFAGSASYDELWWKKDVQYGARQYQGIQLLPMTASMLYVGYDSSYAQAFYNQDNFGWNDIWTRFYSIFNNNASSAWDLFLAHHNPGGEIDDGGTATYTYHFIDFFRQNGNLETKYTSNFPAYLVTNKNDTPVFNAYNYTNTVQDVKFYDNSGYLGYMKVLPKSFMSTTKLLNEKNQTELLIFPVPYKPGSKSMYDGDGITFLGLPDGSNIKIFNIAGELVYEKTIQNADKKFLWNVRNNSGNKIASGIYVYYIISSDGTKYKGKLAIER